MPPRAKAAETAPEAKPVVAPTIGRVVHYQGVKGAHAALITGTYDADDKSGTNPDVVAIRVFEHYALNDTHIEFAKRADVPTVGSWNWPPRV